MVQSVDRALEILEHLKQSPNGLGITDLSRKLGVAKSTVHRLITTLEGHRYVKKISPQGTYQLGLKFLEMNHIVVERLDIIELAHPILDELTKNTLEIAHLGMLDDYELIYIDKVETNSTIRIYSQTGRRAPMHCTGIGKALLAFFPEQKLERFLQQSELTKFTPHTFSDQNLLKNELSLIRDQGYSLDNEEHEESIRCVAAPIFNHLGEVRYAISVTGPSNRMSDQRMDVIIPIVKEAAEKISRQIGY